jgi:hypothetical protein
MALTFQTTDGQLVIPSAPAKWTTSPANSGLSTTGVVLLIGEADVGPDFASESDLTANFFGPRQFAAVQAKYGTGHLVDAYRELTNPSLDAAIKGAPAGVYIVKTNKGEKANGALGSYGALEAKQEGTLGNIIGYSVTETIDQELPVHAAAYVLDALAETINVAVNGTAPYALELTPGYATPTLAALGLLNYLLVGVNQSFNKGVMINGGTSYLPTDTLTGNISVSVPATPNITIALASTTWFNQPVVGQTLIIPSGSTIQGAGSANAGFYIVLSVTLNTVTAKKVKDITGAAPTPPVVVAPVAISGTDFSTYDQIKFTATKGVKRTDQSGISTWSGSVVGSTFVIDLTTPLESWDGSGTPEVDDTCKFQRGGSYWWFKVVSATANSATLTQIAPTVAVAAVPGFISEVVGASTIEFVSPVIDGVGQSLLLQRSVTSTGQQYYAADGNPNTISTTGGVFTSEQERQVSVNVVRSADNVSESWKAGGNVVLTIGKDTTVQQPISLQDVGNAHTLTLGIDVAIDVSKFKTIGDLAVYINTIPGWHAAANPAFKQFSYDSIDHIAATSPGAQDEVSATNQGLVGAMPCRIKKDAVDMVASVANSRIVQFAPTFPKSGLPDPHAITNLAFLNGGTKGGTTNADIQAAFSAGLTLQCNFVVPLFSQDALADISIAETDTSSTYDVASVNAALSDHVTRASAFKTRRPRQGFPSFRGTFSASKLAAQTLANGRLAGVNFLDVNTLGSNGLQWFQPWMGAAVEAGMQAAGFYRPLFNKGINISGVRSNAGDFKPTDDDQVEDALLNGVTVIRPRVGGGFSFVSDNTTYGVDANFVLNSVQAIYIADICAQTTGQRIERAFIGQSFADVSPTVVMSFFKNIMTNLKSLKLITASSDAVAGYKNVVIDIQAPAILISAELKLATGVYFAPISFLVTEVQGSASI